MNKMTLNWAALLLATVMLAACAGQRDAATKAVGDIEASIASLRDDGSKYAAAELQQAEAGLASLKDQLAKQDFKGVVAAAPAVSAQVATLQQTVASKREEAHAAMAAASEEWRTLNAEVPQMVAAIQSRVDVLAQSKKLPKGVSKEAFESAQTGLEAAKTAWTEATTAFGAGDPVKAVQLGKTAKESGTAALSSLGMG
jgi:DNA repair exonuclease SbcCD ATPase subunit